MIFWIVYDKQPFARKKIGIQEVINHPKMDETLKLATKVKD